MVSDTFFTKAAAAWNVENEPLEHINRRIHDNAPIDQLHQRADRYVTTAFNRFDHPEVMGGRVLEVGSGVGFIMEALDRHLKPKFPNRIITGLDISASMIDKAKQRLAGSPALAQGALTFASYDGLTTPFADNTFDFIFSVAALQHVPKPYVYNLFFEMKRIMKDDGFAIVHLLPFRNLELDPLWRDEVRQQVGLASSGHWHHFYTAEELTCALQYGTGFADVSSVDFGQWTYFSKRRRATAPAPPSAPAAGLWQRVRDRLVRR